MNHLRYLILYLILPVLLAGCVSVAQVNAGFRRIDYAWELDYQKNEDKYRARVIDASYKDVYRAISQTFIDLNLPITDSSPTTGRVIARNAAPAPLSIEEWKKVKAEEEPRMKELGGWFFIMKDDPKEYFIKISAIVKPLSNNKTLVVLDYELDAPALVRQGIVPSRRAPPAAVMFGSIKFWAGLNNRLSEAQLPSVRIRQKSEIDV